MNTLADLSSSGSEASLLNNQMKKSSKLRLEKKKRARKEE